MLRRLAIGPAKKTPSAPKPALSHQEVCQPPAWAASHASGVAPVKEKTITATQGFQLRTLIQTRLKAVKVPPRLFPRARLGRQKGFGADVIFPQVLVRNPW